eukprot:scaffold700_cov560-Prasinococcus_capsulatus_cf.AAC.17
MGGLGVMGVKLAVAMGCKVTVISTSPNKEATAKALGADFLLASTLDDPEVAKKHASSFDFIMSTISSNYDVMKYLPLLDVDGKYCMVGLPPDAFPLHPSQLIFKRNSIVGSLIGGIAETQEMLDFCGEHGAFPEVTLIDAKDVNGAMLTLAANKQGAKRFVIKTDETLSKTTEVKNDDEIDIYSWTVRATVDPPEANLQAHLKRKASGLYDVGVSAPA